LRLDTTRRVYDGPEARNRWAYLKTLARVSVGIATAGLDGCASGKLGEYVAASRGVVATALPMILPGEFAAGVNYIEAATPRGSIDASAALLDDPRRLTTMMHVNHAYCEYHIRSCACVLRTIRQALGERPWPPSASREGPCRCAIVPTSRPAPSLAQPSPRAGAVCQPLGCCMGLQAPARRWSACLKWQGWL